MRFFVKLAASTVGVLCTTASAYFLVDEKKRHGVLFAATTVPTSDGSTLQHQFDRQDNGIGIGMGQ